jgi:hypothetical protein
VEGAGQIPGTDFYDAGILIVSGCRWKISGCRIEVGSTVLRNRIFIVVEGKLAQVFSREVLMLLSSWGTLQKRRKI